MSRLQNRRFPGESAAYRDARDALLEAEMALRAQVEAVAALRRTLPLNVFQRSADGVRHFRGSELLYAPREPCLHSRHVDAIWPLWNVLDTTPGGRGADWLPKLRC